MLVSLLKLIAHSPAPPQLSDLSSRLGVGEELVEAMIDDLARRGFLTPLVIEACHESSGCERCSAARCPSAPGRRAWILTQKGRCWASI